jgi:hypothetical protein
MEDQTVSGDSHGIFFGKALLFTSRNEALPYYFAPTGRSASLPSLGQRKKLFGRSIQ